MIADLCGRLNWLERHHRRVSAEYDRRIDELETALAETQAQAREDAYQTRHFYSAALSDLLTDLRRDLERIPPDVEGALVRIRRLLAGERPAA